MDLVFYIVLALFLFFAFLSACIEGAGPPLFIASFIAYIYFGDFYRVILDFTEHNLLWSIFGVLGYIVVGLLWSFFQWYRYVYKLKQTTGPTEADKKYLRSRLKVKSNIGKISNWIVCWPTSVIIYVVGDLIRDIYKNVTTYIINKCKAVYESITNRIIGE